MKQWDIDARDGMGFMVMNYWQFQLIVALQSGPPILNAACAGDLAGLGKYGATNLDIRSPDHLRKTGCLIPENYVEGSVFSIPFEDGKFKTVVLGEFMEHATFEAGCRAVKECARVIARGGNLVITVPLDGRPNGHNRGGYPEGVDEPQEVNLGALDVEEWSDGVTPWHQTWWSNKMLLDARVAAGLEEGSRTALFYGFTAPCGGWGIVWGKP